MQQRSERLHKTWMHSDRYVPRRFVAPVAAFMRAEAGSGIVMLIAAIVAIVWANSAYGETYFHILETHLHIEFGAFEFNESVEHLINDGLMAIFFFVVGLEIKRELVLGELRDPKAASVPVIAAVGGMVVPALAYLAFVLPQGGEATDGWAIPMATDIAFSVGVLALLGRVVPASIKLFLLALAIVDDLGGILVIAIVFTDDLSFGYLGLAFVGLAAVWLASRVGIRTHIFYLPAAVLIWFFFLESGVHATLAGVALAFLTPVRPMYSNLELKARTQTIIDQYPNDTDDLHANELADFDSIMLSEIARESVGPLARAERRLVNWSSFLIVPLFALANAGVRFEGSIGEALTTPVALGVAVGLVAGKTVGISVFTWIAVKTGLGRLPAGSTWRHVIGVASVAGIGFTVALFITALAFSDAVLADEAKVGIFAGSIVAGIIGIIIFRTGKPVTEPTSPELEPVHAV
jgi:NhaA family Na+:H+ antiporter